MTSKQAKPLTKVQLRAHMIRVCRNLGYNYLNLGSKDFEGVKELYLKLRSQKINTPMFEKKVRIVHLENENVAEQEQVVEPEDTTVAQ